VHMVRHDAPFLYPALLVPRQLVECSPQSSAYVPAERSTPAAQIFFCKSG
jgi:hypothetical protein